MAYILGIFHLTSYTIPDPFLVLFLKLTLWPEIELAIWAEIGSYTFAIIADKDKLNYMVSPPYGKLEQQTFTECTHNWTNAQGLNHAYCYVYWLIKGKSSITLSEY